MATEHNFKVKKGLDVLGGDINLGDGFAYKIDGTTVVDSSRNLSNIGTIEATSGHTTGKFAVKYTGVHASYDFYNNGTTYLNGTTEVNAEFRISSSSSYITHFNYQDAGNNIISQANGGSTTIRNNNGNLFTLSSTGTLSVVGNVIAGNSSTAAILRAHYNDGSYMSLEGFGLVMNRGASYIRPSTNADKTLYIGGADSSLNWASVRFRAGSGLYLNGTQFIDASRNLTNIGTISSGVITSTGSDSGRYTGLEVVNTTNAAGTETAIGLGVVSASNNNCDVKLVANRVGANFGSDFYIEQTDSSGNQQETFRVSESGAVSFTGTLSSGEITTSVGMIVTDTSSTGRGIYRNSTGYDLRVGGGTDNTDGAFISLSGETRGGSNNQYNGRIEYVSGSEAFANQAAVLGDHVWLAKHAGGSANLMVLDSSTGDLNLKLGDYQINGLTVIDTSRNLTNIGSLALSSSITLNNNQRIYFKNSSGTTNSSLYRAGGNATRFEYADNAFIFDAASDTDFEIRQSGDAVVFKVDVQSTVANTSVYTTGNFNAAQNIQTGSTTRITNAGNLINIGSITASGNLQAQNATFTGTGDVTVKIIADTDNVTEGDNPTLGFSQDGNTAGTLFVLGLEGNENTVFQGSKVNAPYIHANVGSDNHPLSIGNNNKLVAQFNSTAASPALTVTKFSNITGTNGSTILNLKNYMGSSTTDGDLSQQKSFIDFQLLDGNTNEIPQVRIGAEVGEGGDANSQTLEGSGAFVVYTNDADTDGSSSIDAGSSLTEKFRVAHDGTSTFTNNVVIGGNLTVNGTQTTLNTATLQVEDKNIVLNYGTGDTSGSADGAGITIQDAVNSTTDATILWNSTLDRFDISHSLVSSGNVEAVGFLQHFSFLYSRNNLRVLNAAGTGWHDWATRSNGNFNLNVGTISSGSITSTGNVTASNLISGNITVGSNAIDNSSSRLYLQYYTPANGVDFMNNKVFFNSSGDATFAGTISSGTITVGTTTDSSKITFPDKNVSDNPTVSGDKRQLISMGNSGAGGMWQTTGRGGLMLASADDSLILASGDVGRGHDPDAGGWNPNPDDEQIYLLTDSGIIFRTNLQTVSDYKQMSFDANGDLAVARNISASGTVTASGNISSSSGIQTAGTTRLDSTGNLINIGAITATGNVQHTGLTMTSGTDIDQLYTVTDSLTLTTSYQDTSINSTELATGTYIMQLYIAGDHSVGGSHYNEFYSGVISWYGASTNSPEVDEIVLHRAGHAPNSSVIHLRTQRNYSGGDNLVLQIKGNYNMTAARDYVFKFRRMI